MDIRNKTFSSKNFMFIQFGGYKNFFLVFGLWKKKMPKSVLLYYKQHNQAIITSNAWTLMGTLNIS